MAHRIASHHLPYIPHWSGGFNLGLIFSVSAFEGSGRYLYRWFGYVFVYKCKDGVGRGGEGSEWKGLGERERERQNT